MKLFIEDLTVSMSLGMLNWEKKSRRNVIFNIDITYDGARAALSGNIRDTVNYAELEQHIITLCNARHYDLLETLITVLGKESLTRYPLIQDIMIEATKPGALRQAESVSVAETFTRD